MGREAGGVGRAEPLASIDDANFHPLFSILSLFLSLVCWRPRRRGAHSLYSSSYLGRGPYSAARPHFPFVLQSLLMLDLKGKYERERGFELEAATSSLVRLLNY